MALTVLGSPVQIANANLRGSDKIDDWHLLTFYTIQNAPSNNGEDRFQVAQMTTSGPVLGPQSSDATLEGTMARVEFAVCVFPGTSFGLAVHTDTSTGRNDIYARLCDVDLGDQSVTVYAEVTASPAAIANEIGDLYLYGINSTKAVLFFLSGGYVYFTRSGTTLTIEVMDIDTLDPSGGNQYYGFGRAPSNKVWALFKDNFDDIHVDEITLDPPNNNATRAGSPINVENQSNFYNVLYNREHVSFHGTSDGLIVARNNTDNPDFVTVTGQLNHVDIVGASAGSDYQEIGSFNYRVTPIKTDTFICSYTFMDGPARTRVGLFTFNSGTGVITIDPFPLDLVNFPNLQTAEVSDLYTAVTKDWAMLLFTDQGPIIDVYQIDGGGGIVIPSNDFDLVYSGQSLVASNADGSKICLALQDGASANQLLFVADRDDLMTFTLPYDNPGTLCNVAVDLQSPQYLYLFGNFGTEITVLSFDLDASMATDISPTETTACSVLEANEEGEILAGMSTDQKVWKYDGVQWTELPITLTFDPSGFDGIFSGSHFPDRFMIGGVPVLYTPNEGLHTIDYTGTITSPITSIAIAQ